MPAINYRLKWPDHTAMDCYSPSTAIRDFLVAGQAYSLAEFLCRIREATAIASERVRAKYGFACSSALDQLAAIEDAARRFEELPDGTVTVVSIGEGV